MLLHLAESKFAWMQSHIALPNWVPSPKANALAVSAAATYPWAHSGCVEVSSLGCFERPHYPVTEGSPFQAKQVSNLGYFNASCGSACSVRTCRE